MAGPGSQTVAYGRHILANPTFRLDRLVGSRVVFSFDLKSATDRWPLLILFRITTYLFDRSFASSAVNSSLAYNIALCDVKRHASLSFVAGQPLGYASCPLFALPPYLDMVVCRTGRLFTLRNMPY